MVIWRLIWDLWRLFILFSLKLFHYFQLVGGMKSVSHVIWHKDVLSPLFLEATIFIKFTLKNWIIMELPPPNPILVACKKNGMKIMKLWVNFWKFWKIQFFFFFCLSRFVGWVCPPPHFQKRCYVLGNYSFLYSPL